MSLTIRRKEVQPGIVVLELSGRFTPGRADFGEHLFDDPVEYSQDVNWQILDLLENGCKRVVFDLSRVQFLDSSGVGIIVKCAVTLGKAGGQLRVVGATGLVDQTLKMMHVDRMIDFYQDMEAAVAGW